jgi:pyruvate dehydrogenase E1 component alpha subunit
MRAELRDSVINEPDLGVAEVFDSVYHRITPELVRQRDELAAELAREI